MVGVVAPDAPALLGLVAEIAPALAAGNTVVAILSEARAPGRAGPGRGAGRLRHPGRRGQPPLGPAHRAATALGGHRDLNAIVDAAGDADLGAELDRLAAETIKRARHRDAVAGYETAVVDALERIDALTELKTAWHPVGA